MEQAVTVAISNYFFGHKLIGLNKSTKAAVESSMKRHITAKTEFTGTYKKSVL